MSAIKTLYDGMINLVANLGTSRDKSAHSQYFHTVIPANELEAMFSESWLAKRGVTVPASDATRKWRNWRAESDQIGKIEAEEKRLQLQAKTMQAIIAARLYGGSAIYINTGTASPESPISDNENIISLVVLSRHDLAAGKIVRDINSEYFGRPEFYSIQSSGEPVNIHSSRFALFFGERSNFSLSGDHWGDSVLQSAREAIRNADATVANIASLIFESKVDVMNVEGFADLLAANQDDVLLRRARLQATMKGTNGMIMLDAKDRYDSKAFGFGGLSELWSRFQEWVSGAFGIPVTRMFGLSSAGLSGSGDGDERTYYDSIEQLQTLTIAPALERLDNLLIRQSLGSRPPEVFYDWAPLRQLSESDRANIFNLTATALRSLAGANAGELIPIDALSDSAVNELTEMGVLPGLEQKISEYGSLREQNSFTGFEE